MVRGFRGEAGPPRSIRACFSDSRCAINVLDICFAYCMPLSDSTASDLKESSSLDVPALYAVSPFSFRSKEAQVYSL